MYDQIKNEIFQRLSPLKPTASGYFKRNCPLCHLRGETADTRSRFGIKADGHSLSANCFNCKFKMHWQYPDPLKSKILELMSGLGFTKDEVSKLQFALKKESVSYESDDEEIVFEEPIYTKWVESSLPDNSVPLDKALELDPANKDIVDVANYLINRKIYDLDRIYYSVNNGGFRRRFIIPFYYNKKIVGYSSRTIDQIKSSKYVMSSPLQFIYNIDEQKSYSKKILLVTEGVLDAFQTTGIATLGAISDKQATMIQTLGKRVIVVPDRDRAGQHLVDMAIKRKWEVSFPKWESHVKDPAQAVQEYGKLYTIESIIDGAEKNPISIQIKRKLDI